MNGNRSTILRSEGYLNHWRFKLKTSLYLFLFHTYIKMCIILYNNNNIHFIWFYDQFLKNIIFY